MFLLSRDFLLFIFPSFCVFFSLNLLVYIQILFFYQFHYFFCCCCNFSYLMNKTFMKLPLFSQMTNFKLFSLPKLSYTINFIFIMITLMENRNGKRKKIVCGFFVGFICVLELSWRVCVYACMCVCVWARESIIYCPLCYRIISHAEKFCLISGSFLNIHVEWACELSLH